MTEVSGLPMPGQQFGDPARWMVGDASEDIGDIELRVKAAEFGGFDQRVHGGGTVTAGVGAREQIILATNRDEAFIVPPIFNYLGTLEVGFPYRRDTGDLFARSRR